MRIPLIILMILALVGCATSYSEPPLSSDHPASAAAMESPPSPRSRTLDLAAAEPIAVIPPTPAMDHAADMGHIDAAPASTGGEQPVSYACPMHPEITSNQPDQRCPKCGMKLKAKSVSGGSQ